jgi:hypothetical protein
MRILNLIVLSCLGIIVGIFIQTQKYNALILFASTCFFCPIAIARLKKVWRLIGPICFNLGVVMGILSANILFYSHHNITIVQQIRKDARFILAETMVATFLAGIGATVGIGRSPRYIRGFRVKIGATTDQTIFGQQDEVGKGGKAGDGT